MRWFLPTMTLVAILGCTDHDRAQGVLSARLYEEYGRHKNTMNHAGDGGSPRLELEFTGVRWRGMEDGIKDSALAVARYAMANFPSALPRPDTVLATFRTSHVRRLASSSTTWRGDTIAVADL